MDQRRSAPDNGFGRAGRLTEPDDATMPDLRPASQVASIGIFVIMLGAFLYFAHALALPVVGALVIGTMLGPLVERGRRLGVPSWLGALAVLMLLIGVVNAVILLLSAPVAEWIAKGPAIAQEVKQKLMVFEGPLNALDSLRRSLMPKGDQTVTIAVSNAALVQPVLNVLTPALGQLVIFFGTLFFFLAGRSKLRQHTVTFFKTRAARLAALHILNDIDDNLAKYLGVVSLINLAVGVITTSYLWLLGYPSPVTWGALAFILNFIPYLGPSAMVLILFAIGTVTFPALGQALIAPAIYILVASIEGNFVTPTVAGRRLTLHPFAVFLSLIFWTWMWGPLGAFLATPLLIVAHVARMQVFPKDEISLPD